MVLSHIHILRCLHGLLKLIQIVCTLLMNVLCLHHFSVLLRVRLPFDICNCRDILRQFILFVGILLVSIWHLPARTLSESGRLDQEVRANVFMS